VLTLLLLARATPRADVDTPDCPVARLARNHQPIPCANALATNDK
jgi:hypothetical protein